MIATVVGRVILVAHAPSAPSEAEWTALLQRVEAIELATARFLVFTEGGKPSPAQQASLSKALAHRARTVPVAVLSDHVGIRFVASALAFFLPRIKTFRVDDLPAACAYLALEPSEARAAHDFAARRLALGLDKR